MYPASRPGCRSSSSSCLRVGPATAAIHRSVARQDCRSGIYVVARTRTIAGGASLDLETRRRLRMRRVGQAVDAADVAVTSWPHTGPTATTTAPGVALKKALEAQRTSAAVARRLERGYDGSRRTCGTRSDVTWSGCGTGHCPAAGRIATVAPPCGPLRGPPRCMMLPTRAR